ncbi:MAG TPA: preprotein translocase subunit YajC [Gaiellaceae bacterium]|nr:preprotein translocase subunit YajC [Gaiellaceae bacterium]
MNGGSLIILLALFAVLWLVMIRPQRARQQRQQQMLEAIEPGDEVLTVGGLYGIVQSIDEEGDLIVEIAEGIHVRIARRSVATVVKPEEEGEEADGDAGEERGEVAVHDEDASLEATQKRLFGRRR